MLIHTRWAKRGCHKTLPYLLLLASICNTTPSFANPIALNQTSPAGSVSASSTSSNHTSSNSAVNLDFGSTSNSVVSPTNASIMSGGHLLNVSYGSYLTPAQAAALMQVISGANQTLVLGASGNAIGGTFVLDPQAGQTISNLIIPTGVTVLGNYNHAAAVNIAGNLTNSGTFVAISSNPALTSVTVNATNITNTVGGVITSALPAGLSINNLSSVAHLNLTLNAVNNITNYGLISSSGSLTAIAGNSIINSLPTGSVGPTPVMQALVDVNLISNNIINSGTIAANNGNLNLASLISSQLSVNNTGGILQAINGAVNFRAADFLDKMSTTISGGSILAKEMNVNGGLGEVVADIISTTARINISSGSLRLNVAEGESLLGNIAAFGDPLITSNGSYTLSGDIITNGNPLSVIATNDIIDDGSAHQINTSAAAANGGSILLAAGTNWTANGGTVSFTGPNAAATGGAIRLPNLSTLKSNGGTSFGGNFNGGSIYLLAYGGSGAGAGTITLPANLTISTGASNSGKSGSFTAMAGADSLGNTNSISIGSVNTMGSFLQGGQPIPGTGSGGNIFLATNNPTGALIADAASGAIISNSLQPSSNYTNASIQTKSLITGNGGNIAVVAGNNFTSDVEYVLRSTGYSGQNGSISLTAGANNNAPSGSINILSTGSNLVGTTDQNTAFDVWFTVGVTNSPTQFQTGIDMINAIMAGGRTYQQALTTATQNVNSGLTLPDEKVVPAGTVLYKYVPSGTAAPAFSQFWADQATAQFLTNNPNQIGNLGALPPTTAHATAWDLYTITAQQPSTIFTSITAPTPITDTGVVEDGGIVQTLVPNRTTWGAPVLAGNVLSPTPVEHKFSLASLNNISLFARGNISIAGDTDTHSGVFGKNVVMCAGCLPQLSSISSSISASTPSQTGGQISLFTNIVPTALSVLPVTTFGGGNNLLALAGATPAPGAGTFNFNSGSSINTFGSPAGSGNIFLLASANSGTSMNIGSVISNGGNNLTPSNITIATASGIGSAVSTFPSGALSYGFAIGETQPASAITGDINSNGGSIDLTAGNNFTAKSIVATQRLGNGPGGRTNLNVSNGELSTGSITTNGYSSSGGTINLDLSQLTVTGTNAAGASIQASGIVGGALYGNIRSNAPLVIGSAAGSNRLASDIKVEGTNATGGVINLSTGGALNVNKTISANGLAGGSTRLSSATNSMSISPSGVISSNGTTGTGGFVTLAASTPGSTLTVANDGLVSASNNAKTNGRVGFSAGYGGSVTVTGNGNLLGGEFVSAGNLDQFLAPLSTSASAVLNLHQNSILSQLLLSPVGPPPQPSLSQASSNQSVSTALNITPLLLPTSFASIQKDSAISSTIIRTDQTPPRKGTLNGEVTYTFANSSQIAGQAQIFCTSFDNTTISLLRNSGIIIGNGSTQNFLDLQKGGVLLSPANEPIIIKTNEGWVHLNPGSIAYVIAGEKDLTVLALSENRLGDIKVISCKRSIDLRFGEFLLINRGEASEVDAAMHIPAASRNMNRQSLPEGRTAFTGEFSVPSAVAKIGLISAMLKQRSLPLADRKRLEQVLKNAVVLSIVTAKHGPYQGSDSKSRSN